VIAKPAEAVAHAVEKAAVAVAHAAHVGRRGDPAAAPDPAANGALPESVPEKKPGVSPG